MAAPPNATAKFLIPGPGYLNTTTTNGDSIFANNLTIDGYQITFPFGATENQFLQYDGTRWLAANLDTHNFGDTLYIGQLHASTIQFGSATSTSIIFPNSTLSFTGTDIDFINSRPTGTAFKINTTYTWLTTDKLLSLNNDGYEKAYVDAYGGIFTNSNLTAETIATTVGTAVASATTITPITGLFHITGTTTITTINVPTAAGGNAFTGTINFITDSSLSFGAGGNIATSGQITTAAGQIYSATYDGTNWYIK